MPVQQFRLSGALNFFFFFSMKLVEDMQVSRLNRFISAIFLFCIFVSWKTGVEKNSLIIIYLSLESLNSSAVLSNKPNVFKRATTQNQSRIRTAQTKWTKHRYVLMDFRCCPTSRYWAKPGPDRKAEVFFLRQDCQEESGDHIVQRLQKKLSRQVCGATKGRH